MPAVLKITPEDIDTSEKRSRYTVTVVGCGQKGILFANAFAHAGFKVICSDADPSVTKRLAKGKTAFSNQVDERKIRGLINIGQLSVASELKKAVSQSELVVVCIPATIDNKKKIDYSQILNSCKQVGSTLRSGMLVIYSDIAGFGFVEGIMKETLENTSGLKVDQDIGLAYTPPYSSNTDLVDSTANLELRVAGVGNASTNAATLIMKMIAKSVYKIENVKTAEAAALFAIARQDANTALANELAEFCENANIDYFKVLNVESGEKNILPIAVEKENRNESYLLLEAAENVNSKLRISALSRQINEEMIKHSVNLTQAALRSCGKTLRRARIGVLGTINHTSDTGIFVKTLAAKGAKVTLYAPSSKQDSIDSHLIKSSLNDTVEGADCIIILNGEDYISRLNLKKLRPLMKTPSAIVDLAGAYEPEQAETEGFIYRGLGRGIERL